MKLSYESSKCVCCGKSHVCSLLFYIVDKEDADDDKEYFIICPDCASQVYKYVGQIKSPHYVLADS